jgi:DNA-binding NarL/FixJ family response regulator
MLPFQLRILLIDDHPLVRCGLRYLIAPHSDLQIAAEASDGPSALQHANHLMPDVVLCAMDLPGTDGLTVTRLLRRHHPRCGIIVLTTQWSDEQLFNALRAGAAAYATTEISGDELVAMIRQVGMGQYVINDQVLRRPQVAGHVLTAFREVNRLEGDQGEVFAPLTPREVEILDCVARGNSNKEIARLLSISDQTVKNHMTSILRKLAVNDRTQAVIYALRHGWIKIADSTQA